MTGSNRGSIEEVTLGEVYRAVLRIERSFDAYKQEHREEHDSNTGTTRWQVTTALSLIGLIVSLALSLVSMTSSGVLP